MEEFDIEYVVISVIEPQKDKVRQITEGAHRAIP
jgi:hypothetical protein